MVAVSGNDGDVGGVQGDGIAFGEGVAGEEVRSVKGQCEGVGVWWWLRRKSMCPRRVCSRPGVAAKGEVMWWRAMALCMMVVMVVSSRMVPMYQASPAPTLRRVAAGFR